MSTKEHVLEEIGALSEAEIQEVAAYLAFLKYRSQRRPPVIDESQLAALYSECAEEDRSLAEEGMADYAADLIQEDAK